MSTFSPWTKGLGTPNNPAIRFTRGTVFAATLVRDWRDLGYANGQNIAIDYPSVEGHGERFPALAAECPRLKAGHRDLVPSKFVYKLLSLEPFAAFRIPTAKVGIVATYGLAPIDVARSVGVERLPCSTLIKQSESGIRPGCFCLGRCRAGW